ncbi:MAG: IclR family transcriptional regulator [Thermoleophilaceae bacterium]
MSSIESWHVIRTLRAMELLAVRPRSAPKLADELGVHTRTARRLLKRLADQGYVVRDDEEKTYAPTMKIVALAGQVVERAELSRIGLPFVRELREEVGETAHLSVSSYLSALCVVHDQGDQNGTRPHLRELVPAHATAAGKALMAHRSTWGDAILAQPLERHTERTLVEPEELSKDLLATRERGYAVEDREYQDNVRAVAAPVFKRTGEAIAALGFCATVERLPAGVVEAAGETVRRLAGALSTELGRSAKERARAAAAPVEGADA